MCRVITACEYTKDKDAYCGLSRAGALMAPAWMDDYDPCMRASYDVDERISFVWSTSREFHVSRSTRHVTHTCTHQFAKCVIGELLTARA